MNNCPRCDAPRLGGWGVYKSIWDCRSCLTIPPPMGTDGHYEQSDKGCKKKKGT